MMRNPSKNRSPKKAKPTTGASRRDTWEDLSTSIPLDDGPKPPAYRVLPSRPPKSPAKSRIRGVRLLIVDDDPIRVDALAMDLRNLGAIVAVGDRSTSGYAQAAKFLPDAIVSDLVRPGEDGFRFIQTLRRHPLLRWSSVILSRWWQDTSEAEGRVLLDQVLDQLEELLTPVRIIEERIAAKRPLGDRLEMTGPAALLRLLSNAQLSGALLVNDGWNHFVVELSDGNIVSAYRKGIDGKADDGLDAIIQLMLTDTGKWSFDQQKQDVAEPTLNTEEILSRTNRILSRLFGQPLKTDPTLPDHIIVRPHFLRTATETVPPSAIEIARNVADGADLDRLKKFFVKKNDLAEVERIVHTLFRCGAIRYVETPVTTKRTQKDEAASTSVVNLLDALHDNPFAPKTSRSRTPKPPYSPLTQPPRAPAQGAPKGAYHLQDVAPERVVVAKQRPIKLTLKESSGRAVDVAPALSMINDEITDPAGIGVMGEERDNGLMQTTSTSGTSGRPRNKRVPTRRRQLDESRSRKLVVESQKLALEHLQSKPESSREKKDLRHMWVAIALALLLGALLVSGIILISSVDSSRDVPDPKSSDITKE